MTREDIMEMAREAKLFQHVPPTSHVLFIYDLMEFAALVTAHERLSCAKTAFLFGRTEAEALEIWNAIYKRDAV